MSAVRFPPAWLDELRDRCALASLIGGRVKLVRSGREWKGCCPFHNERTPSFYVIEAKGFWHCFGCGAHGSAVDFVMRLDNVDFLGAIERLAGEAGMVLPDGRRPQPARPTAPRVERMQRHEVDAERARDAERSRDLWRHAVPAKGTAVERYLAGRGITIPVPPTVRYVPALAYWHGPRKVGEFPAMIGAMQAADRSVVGLHRTYLDAETSAKLAMRFEDAEPLNAKKMMGRSSGCAVRLAAASGTLALSEGIETGLSVLQCCPELPVWAALSLGNLAGGGAGEGRRRSANDPKTLAAYERGDSWPRLPTSEPDMDRPGLVPPPGTRRLLLLADADNKDPPAAEALLQRAVARYRRMGLAVGVARPEPGHDFNSMMTRSVAEVAA